MKTFLLLLSVLLLIACSPGPLPPNLPWSSTMTYMTGDSVVEDYFSFSPRTFVSLLDSNLGNLPSSSPAWWRETP